MHLRQCAQIAAMMPALVLSLACAKAADRVAVTEISNQLTGDASIQPASFAGIPELPPSQQLEVTQERASEDWEEAAGQQWWQKLDYDISGYARGTYQYDHRIWFTGQASDFSVEGGMYGYLQTTESAWTTRLDCELYLNQPFDNNRLVDTPQRVSYDHNFKVEALQISQLLLSTRHEDFLLAVGKMVTPFGRFYFPLMTNRMDDAPFIRSEAILWRETGLLAQYDPGIFIATAALTNGGPDRDANSSKAIIGRVGLQEEDWAVGTSIKWQDGIGSEGQKETNNHAGIDAMFRHGPWTFSGELIYDEYGLRRGDLDLDDIFWGRSLYNRQIAQAKYGKLHGVGYYLDAGYFVERWQFNLNYGEYHPHAVGERIHDAVSRRGIFKAAFNITSNFAWYGMLMIENTVPAFKYEHDREGLYFLTGFQAML